MSLAFPGNINFSGTVSAPLFVSNQQIIAPVAAGTASTLTVNSLSSIYCSLTTLSVANVAGNIALSGTLSAPVAKVATVITQSFTRTFDTTANGVGSIASYTGITGSWSFDIAVITSTSSQTFAAQYRIAAGWNVAGSTWKRCMPLGAGNSNPDEYELQVSNGGSGGSIAFFRLIHTTASVASAVTVSITCRYNVNDTPTVADLTSTAQSTDANWSTYGYLSTTMLTQRGGNVGIGQNLPAYTLDVAGVGRIGNGVLIPGTNVINMGSDQTKEVSAGKIGYQTFTSGALDMIGAGTIAGSRAIKLWDNVTVAGSAICTGSLIAGNGGTLTGTFNWPTIGTGSGLTWGSGPYSKIVDDSDLRICTDDNMHFHCGGMTSSTYGTEVLTLTSGGAKFPQLPISTTYYMWKYYQNGNGPSSSGGGCLGLPYTLLTLQTFTGLQTSNIIASNGSGNGVTIALITFPFSGIYALTFQARWNSNSSTVENCLWFAPYVSATYNESNANSNGSRLCYASTSSINQTITYTGYFAINDTLALYAYSSTANQLVSAFGAGVTVCLLQKTA